jgi:hypothetical protein
MIPLSDGCKRQGDIGNKQMNNAKVLYGEVQSQETK